MIQLNSLLTMKAYLIHLNNEQRAAKAAKDWKNANTTAASMKKAKPFKHVTFRSSQPIVRSSMPSDAVNRRPFTDPQCQADEQAENCFICHWSGHLAGDCMQQTRSATLFQHDRSVSELHMSHENSESESENE